MRGMRWILPALAVAGGCDLTDPRAHCPDFELESVGLEQGALDLVPSDWGLVALGADSTLHLRTEDRWSEIGPPGATVAAVVAAPDLLLAAVVEGHWGVTHLLGSEDGGLTWAPHGPLQEVERRTCCVSLTASRHAPQSLLLHEHLPGVGHYSSDGGSSWQEVRLVPEGYRWVRSARATRDGFVASGYRSDAGSERTFQYSMDGGATVRDAEIQLDERMPPFRAIWEDRRDPEVLWATNGSATLHHSRDGGRSWTPGLQADPELYVMDLAVRGDDVILAGHEVRPGMLPGLPPPLALQRHPSGEASCPAQVFRELQGAAALAVDGQGDLLLGTSQGVFRAR